MEIKRDTDENATRNSSRLVSVSWNGTFKEEVKMGSKEERRKRKRNRGKTEKDTNKNE